MIDPLLLTATSISTFLKDLLLTKASGFLFEREGRLFLVTSRHVLIDRESGHVPERIEIELHTNPENLAESVGFSVPLYVNESGVWRQGVDSSGEIDVGVIELDRKALPETAVYRAFSPGNLLQDGNSAELGASLLILGFPLGFQDTLHHLPVVRHAIIASSFGLRFQGDGFFLTDARTHRGSSGAAVVMRATGADSEVNDLPWLLLGIHSSRLDMGSRDQQVDEALGLNCAWYADILMTLTKN